MVSVRQLSAADRSRGFQVVKAKRRPAKRDAAAEFLAEVRWNVERYGMPPAVAAACAVAARRNG